MRKRTDGDRETCNVSWDSDLRNIAQIGGNNADNSFDIQSCFKDHKEGGASEREDLAQKKIGFTKAVKITQATSRKAMKRLAVEVLELSKRLFYNHLTNVRD